ncbi:hypothetical protein GQ44DRAFT_494067 [Phaeosphaeriaceae sp. PMI808]|nr:hypothetical protein GQ44DRAFT_494067 [Phaeosphaeriaceae sp. PMI808]
MVALRGCDNCHIGGTLTDSKIKVWLPLYTSDIRLQYVLDASRAPIFSTQLFLTAAMAKSIQRLTTCVVYILIVPLLLATVVHGLDNGTFVDQSRYTNFELFKNTHLQSCPQNTSVAGSITPRDPRGGAAAAVVVAVVVVEAPSLVARVFLL